jgi:hypothetical protein
MEEPVDEISRRSIVRLQQRYKKRRHRAQLLLALAVILGITFITLQSDNLISAKIRSISSGSQKFNGDLGSISPFAKKKVCFLFLYSNKSVRISMLSPISAGLC